METQQRINWNFDQDNLLNLSLEKSKKKNWNKIFYSLQNKNIKGKKARWMGWKHGMVKKENWNFLEDSMILYQIKFIVNYFNIKFSCKKRTIWQCFFRKAIILDLLFVKRNQQEQPKPDYTRLRKLLSRGKFVNNSKFRDYLKNIKNTRLQVAFL